jgi:hypothetical protein
VTEIPEPEESPGEDQGPTEPMAEGNENPTEPIPSGGENPTEPLEEGNESPTEPLGRGEGGDQGVWVLLGSVAAALLLVGVYLAAGGLDFKPAAAADPCDVREWGDPQGIEQTAERFSISAIDGAACELGVSREELTRALATEESRIEFGEEKGLSDSEIEDAIRSGLMRAIDDGENAGAIGALAASGLRLTVRVMPVGAMAALALDASELFQENTSGGIDGLIDGALDALGGLGSGDSGSSTTPGSGSSGSTQGGSGSSGLDELERQLRENIPDRVPPEVEDQIQKGLDNLIGP